MVERAIGLGRWWEGFTQVEGASRELRESRVHWVSQGCAGRVEGVEGVEGASGGSRDSRACRGSQG